MKLFLPLLLFSLPSSGEENFIFEGFISSSSLRHRILHRVTLTMKICKFITINCNGKNDRIMQRGISRGIKFYRMANLSQYIRYSYAVSHRAL